MLETTKKNALVTAIAAMSFGTILSVAHAAPDRTPPTSPTPLTVVGRPLRSVSLSWNAASDDSGTLSYRIHRNRASEVSLPQSQTSFIWTANMVAGQSYSFYVYAVDAAGNRSSRSNTVSITLPLDTTSPTPPVISLNDMGPTHVSLAWTSSDDGDTILYYLFQDGRAISHNALASTAVIPMLDSGTTYTFLVRAQDTSSNSSFSAPFVVTTLEADPDDVTAPTTPPNFQVEDWGCGEILLTWEPSTDDVDPTQFLRYDLILNGVIDYSVSLGATREFLYPTRSGLNSFGIVAEDSAGNRSPAATIALDINVCF